MKQWEIYNFAVPSVAGVHPFVILSNNFICQEKRLQYVNGLLCTSVRGKRAILDYEVVVDEADGLDWKTAIACDFIFQLKKAEAPLESQKIGQVSIERRRGIVRAITRGFLFDRVG